ncbi:MAG: hypothetical protein WCG19_05675 [Chlorobiaceae bacterium]
MKIVQNSGTERVIYPLRLKLIAGCQLDIVTPYFFSFSLFPRCFMKW